MRSRVGFAVVVCLGIGCPSVVRAVPLGAIVPAGRVAGRMHGGPFVAVDGGAAFLLGTDADPAQVAGTFGARVGYDFRSGLALFAGYDDLGVAPLVPSTRATLEAVTVGDRAVLQLASVGARYTLPLFVPMLFAEASCGAAFVADETDFAAEAGLGLTLPLGRHFSIDLAGRTYLVPVEGTLRTTFTAGAGFAFRFGR